MKIDIAIPFNDLVPPKNIGMVQSNKPPFYNQLLYLIKSIQLNWDKSTLDYSLYAHHSRKLDKKKQEKLESLGCTVVYNGSEIQPYLCRENIFNYETDGDQTLILDTDMIVLHTPTLENAQDIYVKVSDPNVLNQKQWIKVFNKMKIRWTKKWGRNGRWLPARPCHFNGGCMLIKNDKKKEFYDCFADSENLKVLRWLAKKNRHMGIQVYYSLVILKFNWGVLNERVNAYSLNPNLAHMLINNDIDILHYLGRRGMNDEVRKILSKIGETI